MLSNPSCATDVLCTCMQPLCTSVCVCVVYACVLVAKVVLPMMMAYLVIAAAFPFGVCFDLKIIMCAS